MTYEETLDYLYNSAPLFQHIGKDAYKEGLENTYLLDEYFEHPHRKFHTIHIAGTNGKGSCSHTLAAILQSAGYKTGLYTSPHLIDFRERIRINGTPVSQKFVIDFVEKHRTFFEPLHPSFFELTTAMAFHYFATQQVDVAIIEVGLGGRLDCTNIIHPDLCLITNISFDHIQFLGNTLAKIAGEKAGIIKENTPIIIGETTPETKPVFIERAQSVHAPILFAEEEHLLQSSSVNETGERIYQTTDFAELKGELGGLCQLKNTNTLLSSIRQLKKIGYHLTEENVREGFAHVSKLTGLMGRWQKLQDAPTLICDTGHNVGGITYITEQLKQQSYQKHCHGSLHMGMLHSEQSLSPHTTLPVSAGSSHNDILRWTGCQYPGSLHRWNRHNRYRFRSHHDRTTATLRKSQWELHRHRSLRTPTIRKTCPSHVCVFPRIPYRGSH